MNKKNFLISGSIMAVLILVLVWVAAQTTVPVTRAQAAVGTTTATPGTVQVMTDPKLGPILKDGNGLTLYFFGLDTPGVSKCSGACAAAWPPYTLPSGAKPTAGPGVTGKLGTLTRPDGTVQVTINNLPLYRFIKDKVPGDTFGQGVNAFGGLWVTVKPNGTPNMGAGTPMPTGMPTP